MFKVQIVVAHSLVYLHKLSHRVADWGVGKREILVGLATVALGC